MKKLFCTLLAAAIAFSLTGCDSDKSTASADDIIIDDIQPITTDEKPFGPNGGKVLRIASTNNAFKDVLDRIYGLKNLPEGIEFEYVTGEYTGDGYTSMLNTALYEEEPIDIFIMEPDYMLPYINSELCLPLSEAGITENDTEEMFPYTISLGTSYDGVLKAVSYQVEPGVFVYRRDIAMKVFGNDDPEYINGIITNDWNGTAAALAESGYCIMASADETYRIYEQNRIDSWVDEEGYITVPEAVSLWAENMRNDVLNGFNHNYSLWSWEWLNEMNTYGTTFGFYLASWETEATLPAMRTEEEGFGKWGICLPPEPFYWGGTYLCISSRTDNLELCGEILKALCCDRENQLMHISETYDCCNNRSALMEYAESKDGYSEFYEQNVFEVYCAAAENVAVNSNITEYDTLLNELYVGDMRYYINGYSTYEEAFDAFNETLDSYFAEVE